MRMKLALLLAAAAVVTAAPSVALATPGFPAAIETHLALAYVPPCTVCHQGTPQNGTATTAFAIALKGAGLTAGNDATVATALDAITTHDSDSNGTTDEAQLKAGCDPNTDAAIETGATCGGGGSTDVAPTTAYGCANTGAQIAAGPASSEAVLGGLLAALGLALSRRRARSRRASR
jgi:opacity protein-like surface antigen